MARLLRPTNSTPPTRDPNIIVHRLDTQTTVITSNNHSVDNRSLAQLVREVQTPVLKLVNLSCSTTVRLGGDYVQTLILDRVTIPELELMFVHKLRYLRGNCNIQKLGSNFTLRELDLVLQGPCRFGSFIQLEKVAITGPKIELGPPPARA